MMAMSVRQSVTGTLYGRSTVSPTEAPKISMSVSEPCALASRAALSGDSGGGGSMLGANKDFSSENGPSSLSLPLHGDSKSSLPPCQLTDDEPPFSSPAVFNTDSTQTVSHSTLSLSKSQDAAENKGLETVSTTSSETGRSDKDKTKNKPKLGSNIQVINFDFN